MKNLEFEVLATGKTDNYKTLREKTGLRLYSASVSYNNVSGCEVSPDLSRDIAQKIFGSLRHYCNTIEVEQVEGLLPTGYDAIKQEFFVTTCSIGKDGLLWARCKKL